MPLGAEWIYFFWASQRLGKHAEKGEYALWHMEFDRREHKGVLSWVRYNRVGNTMGNEISSN